MQPYSNIHDYITSQQTMYKRAVPINDKWDWSMAEHIRLAVLYKNSQFSTTSTQDRPYKNIIRPILNLQYRAEGFDVKDITLFIDDSKEYYKSFLVKKFHEKWARENGIDTVIDAMVESYIDFGGALLKNVDDVKPEVVPLQSIAFCDQTDILSGPIGIKHYYSPDQLLEMADKGWGDSKNGATATLEEAIVLSREEKRDDKQGAIVAQTPGRYIEIFEVHGNMPKSFRDKTDTSGKYETQLFIGCFYQKKNSSERGFITLFHMPEKKSPFKFIARDAVYGRALGFGGIEELTEPQVWINSNMIHKQRMLEAASKTVLKATGPNSTVIAAKNKLKDLDNLEIIDVGPDSDLGQVDTFPRNIQLFEKSDEDWQVHAQQMGSANDAIMGDSPTAGTPFKLQELVTQESHSLHEYRKGKLATFWDQVEMDWIIPHAVRAMTQGTEFLSELDLKELQYVADNLVTCQTNDLIKERIFNGQMITKTEVDQFKERVRAEFQKKGNKHFIAILKDEMKNAPVSVRTNVAGKQKNLAAAVDKITNIIRFLVQANPVVLSSAGAWDLINQVIEQSGLNPVDFSGLADEFKKMQQQEQAAKAAETAQAQAQAQPDPQQSPLQQATPA